MTNGPHTIHCRAGAASWQHERSFFTLDAAEEYHRNLRQAVPSARLRTDEGAFDRPYAVYSSFGLIEKVRLVRDSFPSAARALRGTVDGHPELGQEVFPAYRVLGEWDDERYAPWACDVVGGRKRAGTSPTLDVTICVGDEPFRRFGPFLSPPRAEQFAAVVQRGLTGAQHPAGTEIRLDLHNDIRGTGENPTVQTELGALAAAVAAMPPANGEGLEFPDLLLRLEAQEGQARASDLWRDACNYADQLAEAEAQGDVDAAV